MDDGTASNAAVGECLVEVCAECVAVEVGDFRCSEEWFDVVAELAAVFREGALCSLLFGSSAFDEEFECGGDGVAFSLCLSLLGGGSP